jgi:hypothetical protein
MMPPEGGYDHAPMQDDFVMPELYDASAEMATPDPTGEHSGAENIATVPVLGDPDFVEAAPIEVADGLQELAEAIGGDQTSEPDIQDGPNQNDVAVGAAIDGATEQGGGVGSGASLGQDFGENGEGEEGNDSQDVDPSAGMG